MRSTLYGVMYHNASPYSCNPTQLLEQSEANLDALRQLDAAIAIAKNELRKSKSDVSTGRDAAADK